MDLEIEKKKTRTQTKSRPTAHPIRPTLLSRSARHRAPPQPASHASSPSDQLGPQTSVVTPTQTRPAGPPVSASLHPRFPLPVASLRVLSQHCDPTAAPTQAAQSARGALSSLPVGSAQQNPTHGLLPLTAPAHSSASGPRPFLPHQLSLAQHAPLRPSFLPGPEPPRSPQRRAPVPLCVAATPGPRVSSPVYLAQRPRSITAEIPGEPSILGMHA